MHARGRADEREGRQIALVDPFRRVTSLHLHASRSWSMVILPMPEVRATQQRADG
jgi:hypothetical protein